jgi:hypothetical protein
LAPSGLPILRHASTSPTAGTKSGTNGFNFVSRSIFYGLYLWIYSNRSLTSWATDKLAYSAGLYVPGISLSSSLSSSSSPRSTYSNLAAFYYANIYCAYTFSSIYYYYWFLYKSPTSSSSSSDSISSESLTSTAKSYG